MMAGSSARNVRLYPLYQAARNSAFWLPVFFLYFSARFDVAEVLLLEALYYGAVVVLEVPSGYLSDRLGRRPTLLIATMAWTLGYLALALGGSWWVFACGQVFVAAGMAFNSGTDSALIFESLAKLGKPRDLAALEGRARAWGSVSMAAAALIGGLLASIDLRLGHALSVGGAAIALGLAWLFHEPEQQREAHRPLAQLRGVGAALRKPALRWLFAFAVSMTVFNHVPYELAQPYLQLVLDRWSVGTFTPAASGCMMAVMMGVAALASRGAAPLGRRLGMAPVLLGAMALQGAVLVGLAALVHPAIVALLLLRSVPGALSRPLELQRVLPELPGHLRATYLSVQSLAGRLAFAVSLSVGSWAVGGLEQLDAPAVGVLAGGSAVGVAAVWAWLWARRRAIADAAET